MAKVYLVRHGKAAAGWDVDLDPGLDDVGRAQAETAALALAPKGPLDILVSPLKRARETARPLEAAWGVTGRIEPAVAEIPSPITEPSRRRPWLDRVMASRWPELDEALHGWRQGIVDRLLAIRQDTVIVSHFVVINVAAGWAEGDNRVIGFRPDNCSCTLFEVAGDTLTLIERGREAETEVR